MRLTPFARLLIVIAILLAVFFGIRYLIQQGLVPVGGQDTEMPEDSRYTDAGPDNPGATPVGGGAARSTFAYNPPKPVNGQLQGVVELGASGFNAFVINVDNQKNWELKKAEFGVSLVYENMATEADVKAGLKQYIAEMINFGVPGREIHFMVSSSAIASPEVQKIKAGLKSLGYVVNTVTPEQEAKYAFQAAMPAPYSTAAFVVDIGSGNTKISWMENGTIVGEETQGSKYYQNDISDGDVYTEVRAKAAKVPQGRRSTCFIIGGGPYTLAQQVREGKERYTVLNMPQEYTPEGEKERAGLNIYQALVDATGCKTFVFDWDANFTIGFLLSLK